MKFVLFLILLLPDASFAETRINLEGNITTDSSTLNTSGAGSKRYAEGSLSFSLYKEASIYFTTGIANFSSSDPATASTNSTYNTTIPFGGFTLVFGKPLSKYMSLGLYYVPMVAASYQETGTGTEIWSGTGLLGKFSLHPPINKFVSFVVSLNYFSATHTNKSGTTVTAATSYSRASMIPSAGFQFFW